MCWWTQIQSDVISDVVDLIVYWLCFRDVFCFWVLSCLLMLFVTLPFLPGSMLHMFLCEPLMDPEFKAFKEASSKSQYCGSKHRCLRGLLVVLTPMSVKVASQWQTNKQTNSSLSLLENEMFCNHEADRRAWRDIWRQIHIWGTLAGGWERAPNRLWYAGVSHVRHTHQVKQVWSLELCNLH